MTMRHIFHEILSRYLDGEQHAFDSSPRELWPSGQFEFQVQIGHGASGLAADPSKRRASPSELESRS